MIDFRTSILRIRKKCLHVTDKAYPKLADMGYRLEFIPVEWRSNLDLNFGTLENITVGQLRPLRSYINHSFIDVLYYTSPIYKTSIIASLRRELTRMYSLFVWYNPEFVERNGQVSILAHSLGSVLIFDLLRGISLPLSFPESQDPKISVSSNHSMFNCGFAAGVI